MITVTEEMVIYAERAYDQHARTMLLETECSRTCLEVAIKAALELAEMARVEPPVVERYRLSQADLDAVQARRARALIDAQEMTEALSKGPTNGRGCAVDGWRAPSLAERTEAILKLAAFLAHGEPDR